MHFPLMQEADVSGSSGGGGEFADGLDNIINASMDETAGEIKKRDGEGGEEKPATTTTTTTTEGEGPVKRSAPKSWAAEQHARFAALPPEVQDYIELREKQMDEGAAKLVPHAKWAQELQKILQPHMEDIKRRGVTEAQAVQYLFGAHQQLSNPDPVAKAAFFMKLAKDYNVPISEVAKALGGAAPDPNASAASANDPRVEGLLRTVNSVVEHLNSEVSQRHEALAAEAKDITTKFFSDPKNVYVGEVAEDLARHLLMYPKMTIQDAYDRACWANPVVRAKISAAEAKAKEEELAKKAKEEAQKARRGVGTVVQSKGDKEGTTSTAKSIEETIDQTMREIKARKTG